MTGSNKNLSFTADGSITAETTIGNISVASGKITSANEGAEFTANKIGTVSVVGHKNTDVLLEDVAFVAKGTGATIGNITLNSSANATGVIASSINGAVVANEGTGFSSTGNIGDITIVGSADGKLLDANTSVLLFRAGSSTMGAATSDSAADAAMSIGNIEITANLSNSSSDVGTGLIIASGVTPGVAGEFVKSTGTAVSGAPRGTRNGSIGTVTINDLGGAGVTGFTGNALASTAFSGGSVIIANSIGDVTIEAGDTVTMTGTGTARKGAIDTDASGTFGGDGDLYVIVL